MDKRIETVDQYIAEFSEFEKAGGSSAPEWIRRMRQHAIGSFAELGFPTTKNEEWKYTNVSPLLKTPFTFSHKNNASSKKYDGVLFKDQKWNRVVCMNGSVVSIDAQLPSGVRCESLAKAFSSNGSGNNALQSHLGNLATTDTNAFTALNTAFIEDGIFLHIPDECVIETPIHIAYVSESPNGATIIHPRTLILLGKNSKATIIETFSSQSESSYVMNAVSEIILDEGATLEHYKIEQESGKAFHIASTSVSEQKHSVYGCTSVMTGGMLTRNEHTIVFNGEEAQCRLDGLYIARGTQHIDNHTTIDHRVAHCASWEYYKGILDDNARAVFNGKVFVREDAQKTDAQQTNKNLILSDNALVDTKPQLEIYADDVKCTHGATVGQLDENMIYYLRSRGISPAAARQMLTAGFAGEILETIALTPVREYLQNMAMEMFLKQGAKQNV